MRVARVVEDPEPVERARLRPHLNVTEPNSSCRRSRFTNKKARAGLGAG